LDPTALSQGLTITFWGLLLTFGTLGLMVLPIYLVNKYQESHPAKEESQPAPAAIETPFPTETQEPLAAEEAAVAAAIAVSILAARREANTSSLGAALETGPGRWWTPSNN
jgi:Na+-transporting methylmalonyl-CoA/oxaloacetate decarboxylase gamma subunit